MAVRPKRDERVMHDQQTAPLEERALLLEVVRALVDDPSRVRVKQVEAEDRSLTLTAYVAYSDMRYVFGRGGRTLDAVQYLFDVIGAREDRAVSLRVKQFNGE